MYLSIGTRVMCINLPDMNRKLVGQTGVIINGGPHSFGVKFDKFIDGHDCCDDCEYGYGWYVDRQYLVGIASNIR